MKKSLWDLGREESGQVERRRNLAEETTKGVKGSPRDSCTSCEGHDPYLPKLRLRLAPIQTTVGESEAMDVRVERSLAGAVNWTPRLKVSPRGEWSDKI